jgi:hypothetical protein
MLKCIPPISSHAYIVEWMKGREDKDQMMKVRSQLSLPDESNNFKFYQIYTK